MFIDVTAVKWRSDGQCGPRFHLPSGEPGECRPNVSANQEGPCCSSNFWCGNSTLHCKCPGCIDFSRYINGECLLRLLERPVIHWGRTYKGQQGITFAGRNFREQSKFRLPFLQTLSIFCIFFIIISRVTWRVRFRRCSKLTRMAKKSCFHP